MMDKLGLTHKVEKTPEFNLEKATTGITAFTGMITAWGIRFTNCFRKEGSDTKVAEQILNMIKNKNSLSSKEGIGCLNHITEKQRKLFLDKLQDELTKEVQTPPNQDVPSRSITAHQTCEIFDKVISKTNDTVFVGDLRSICTQSRKAAYTSTIDKLITDDKKENKAETNRILNDALRHDADIDTPDNGKNTPLMMALMHRKPVAATWFINNNVSLNHVNNHGKTPLDLANDLGDKELIDLLKSKEAKTGAELKQLEKPQQ